MKNSIPAINGSIEFDDNDDIEIFQVSFSAKDQWNYLGGEFIGFGPNAKVIAIHVSGKNTATSPYIAIEGRVGVHGGGGSFDPSFFSPVGINLTGLLDLNHLVHLDRLSGFDKPYSKNVYQFRIHNASSFTGVLNLTFYVVGRR